MKSLSPFDLKKAINFLRRNVSLLFLLFIVSISLFKLWLDLSLRVHVLSFQSYDDALYVSFTQSILKGEWLGNYNQLTLTKNPFYPLWLAFNNIIGVPLLLTQSLFSVIAGTLFIHQLRRIGVHYLFLILIYVLYLFNPFVETRVMREGVYSSLTVMVLTCLIGLFRHVLSSKRLLLSWSVVLGVFLSLFWLTREESIWMFPSVAILLCYSAIRLHDKYKLSREFFLRSSFIILPIFILFLSVSLISLINNFYYGVYRINEQNSKPFVSAYGALLRVEHSAWTQGFHVPQHVREQLYVVSPAFRELKPYIDGNEGSKDLRDAWMKISCSFYPNTTPDYGGAWFMWTLRQAVVDAGYYSSASAADRYYERLLKDINSACDKHLVNCLPRRESVIPPYRPDYTELIAKTWVAGFMYVLTMPVRDYVTNPFATSAADEEGLRSFHSLTHSRVLPTLESVRKEDIKEYSKLTKSDLKKLNILRIILSLYQKAFAYLVYASMVAYVVSVFFTIRTWNISFLFILSTSIAVAIAFRLLILSYIEITLFPAFANWPAYIAPFYPLLLILIGTVFADLIDKTGIVKKRFINNRLVIKNHGNDNE